MNLVTYQKLYRDAQSAKYKKLSEYSYSTVPISHLET